MPEFEPVLLANINRPQSHTMSTYEAQGGYRALRKAIQELDPSKVIDLVKESGLRRARWSRLSNRLEVDVSAKRPSGARLLLYER